ncbi:MAG TPA: FTR1 family protein [Balneolaceae bacterium]|nr:FTR1 family protein [Balneolaceae bacterium]
MSSKIFLLLFVGFICGSLSAKAQDSTNHTQLRTLVNLLDYIGKDYPNAVKDGKVISSSEFQEMNEFSDQIKNLYHKLSDKLDSPRFSALSDSVDELHHAVAGKASQDEIERRSSEIQQRILALNLIAIVPSSWPDPEHGKEIFGQACQSCHGKSGYGDGPAGKALDPQPANFHDSVLASKLSPLQAYNTIRLGISGTGMRAFKELSDKEAWDVAFYINQLNYKTNVSGKQEQKIKKALLDTLSLRKLATWKNEQWIAYFKKKNINKTAGMSVLRSMNASDRLQQQDKLAHAVKLLNSAVEAYKSNNSDQAQTLALNAYLHGVEPMENQIKASSPSLVTDIENKMIDVRSTIKQKKPLATLNKKVETATLSINQAQTLLNNQDYSFWFTFMMAASILLREGLEAVLIILVIISVLKSMEAERSLKFVHGGWLTALILGIISWFFAESLIQMSSLQREMMEGIGSLIAVGMLLYIGFWLHNKTHASQWTKFVKEKISRLVDEKNQWGLAFLAFVVVFREAFESVIFLSSISIKSTTAGDSGIIAGSLSALAAVFLMAVLIVKFSKRLPIQMVFKYSALIMAILAVVLAGKGIHEFQEAGYIGIHSLSILPDLPLLGLYPTLFTIIAQVIIAGFIILLWQYSKRLAMAKN